MSKVPHVRIDGVTHLPLEIQRLPLKKDETPKEAVRRIEKDLSITFTDDLVFHNDGDKYLTIAQFARLPEEVFSKPVEGQKIELFSTPSARVIHRDNELDARVVTKIVIHGVMRADVLKKIRDTLSIKEGDKVTYADIAPKQRELLEKCPLLGVQIKNRPVGDKGEIHLIINAIDEPQEVVISGVEGKEALEIKALVTEKPLTKARIGELDGIIANHFKEEVFLYLTQVKQLDDKGRLVLHVTKVPAPADVIFRGIGLEEARYLRISVPRPLSNANIEKGIRNIRDFYFAKKLVPTIQINFHKTPEDINIVVFTITTTTAVSRLSIRGRHPFDEATVRKAFGESHQDFHIYTPEMVSQGVERVRALFKERGLILNPNSKITIHNDELTLNISPSRIRGYKVIMVGKKDVPSDGLVVREFETKPGEDFDDQKLRKGIWRLQQTGQFEGVHPELDIDPKSGDVEVNVVCFPKDRLQSIEAGAGYDASGPFLRAGAGAINVVKEGARSDVTAIYTPLSKTAMISISDPWLFPGKISGSLSLYATTEQYLIARNRLGIGVNIGIPLGGSFSPWRLTLGTNAEYIKLENQEKIDGMNPGNFLLKPLIKLSYDSPIISTYVQGRIAVGAMSYKEMRAGASKTVDMVRGLRLLLDAQAGKQLGQVPPFGQFGPHSTPSVYGRGSDDQELSLAFAVASTNIQITIVKSGLFAMGVRTGVTVGGIGKNMTDLGVGAALDFVLVGIPIAVEFGGRLNMVDGGPVRFGFNIIGGKWVL